MIVIYHLNNSVIQIFKNFDTIDFKTNTVSKVILEIAQRFPDELLIWCHESCKEKINFSKIDLIFHHKKIMASYYPNGNYFDEKIGYVEMSPFGNINKNVSWATWQMSSYVGGISAEVILSLEKEIQFDDNFDYFLNSIAKLSLPKGLFCYSEPNLILEKINVKNINSCNYILFRFVKQHFRTRWIFILFLNVMIYERKLPVLPFFLSFFFKKRIIQEDKLDSIIVQSSKKVTEEKAIDVIIPTIGRKKYLYDVLCDLNAQTHLPKKVIIVEQNPQENSVSELDYINSEQWNFTIEHIFTHQAGACNARNLALAQVKNDWIFLADDDNRFNKSLIEDVFKKIDLLNAQVITTCYIQENEQNKNKHIIQWHTFGAGNSFIKKSHLRDVFFNSSFEYGYGEDADFGMQLRKRGYDIIYLPDPKILHLKAPVGGFRIKPKLAWQNDRIQPKPSPKVMLYYLLHCTKQQLLGYKTILFFKYYRIQKTRNLILYYKNFQKQWQQSLFWANELRK
jgi:GT2 family glycosyltransferase